MQGRLPWQMSDKSVRLAVIGDLILDEYLIGDVNRISPEAPVPVHHVKGRHFVAGGAANVSVNGRMVGGDSAVFGIIGEDETGRDLTKLLLDKKVDTDGIVVEPGWMTVKKTRVCSQSQQLVRIDWEEIRDTAETSRGQMLKRLYEWQPDVVVLSDYGKGALPESTVTELLASCKTRGIPTVVDPKGRDYRKYRDATLVTPNYAEACLALDLCPDQKHQPESIAQTLIDRYGLTHVLLTLGADGMLFTAAGPYIAPIRLLTVASEVYDVSGAGDTVCALMALGIGAGLDWQSAMTYANRAAGLVVQKWGTATVTAEELLFAEVGVGGFLASSTNKASSAYSLHIPQ